MDLKNESEREDRMDQLDLLVSESPIMGWGGGCEGGVVSVRDHKKQAGSRKMSSAREMQSFKHHFLDYDKRSITPRPPSWWFPTALTTKT